MSTMKTHAEMLARHLANLRVREQELLQGIESLREGLAVVRALIATEEAKAKEDKDQCS